MAQDIKPPGPESERAAPAETAHTLIDPKNNSFSNSIKLSRVVILQDCPFGLAIEARVVPSDPDWPDREFREHSEAVAWAAELAASRGWSFVDRAGEVAQ